MAERIDPDDWQALQSVFAQQPLSAIDDTTTSTWTVCADSMPPSVPKSETKKRKRKLQNKTVRRKRNGSKWTEEEMRGLRKCLEVFCSKHSTAAELVENAAILIPTRDDAEIKKMLESSGFQQYVKQISLREVDRRLRRQADNEKEEDLSDSHGLGDLKEFRKRLLDDFLQYQRTTSEEGTAETVRLSDRAKGLDAILNQQKT
eukprot:GILJ01013011.1.p1 GENE.GILJ01013011.1~~GILJ01013011.1.p1  ORF type:complete len:203 (-),score=34.11 GILJ01013011.1:457-1065(-)